MFPLANKDIKGPSSRAAIVVLNTRLLRPLKPFFMAHRLHHGSRRHFCGYAKRKEFTVYEDLMSKNCCKTFSSETFINWKLKLRGRGLYLLIFIHTL